MSSYQSLHKTAGNTHCITELNWLRSLPENVRAHESLANTPHIGKYRRVEHQPVLNATLASGWVGSATVSWPVQGHTMALDLEELCSLGLDEHHMCLVSHQLALLPLTIPEEPQQLCPPATAASAKEVAAAAARIERPVRVGVGSSEHAVEPCESSRRLAMHRPRSYTVKR